MRPGDSHERTSAKCTTCGKRFSFWRRKHPEDESTCDRCLKKRRSNKSYETHKVEWMPRKRAYGRRYYKANKKRVNKRVMAAHRRRRLADPEAWNKAKRERYTALRQAVLRKLSGEHPKCAECGFDDERALEIDHVHGGGTKHLREVLRETMYRAILRGRYRRAVRILCATCNWLHRLEMKPPRVAQESPSSPTRLRLAVVAKLGGRCKCGETRVDLLHIDHVKGGGSVERRSMPRGRYYRAMLKRPKGFQLLCPNCNALKKRTNPAERPGPRETAA